ncbi:hypothetical protein MBCUT_05720 [Methanobrevibacter cuticularis]|uniref:Zinc-ribbon domain-containing protein n=1 Tax=Methanobrevibacter cuticularis TaxID=47311 RepID=A0A166EJ80_9EURY|nr:zinc ribbon domain-containing protein [Methanobrevibacter cuticularis]KZX16714.1 hypothetical protein MBCUT_05720 [Methanobrevibacter cuticularis]
MVFCSYCGTQNPDGESKCVKCGKPLSLMGNNPSNKRKYGVNSPKSKLGSNNLSSNSYHPESNNSDSINKPIKERYQIRESRNPNGPSPRNSYSPEANYPLDRNFNQNNYNNDVRTKLDDSFISSQKQGYGNPYYHSQQNYESKEVSKSTIEWDVVIATALLVIILSAILNRFIPTLGIFISLIMGLIYILVATKSKLSLVKSIPLAIVMILAVSAYFSI